ncbi:DUF4136 domain-containing protein [Olleya sp. R77988]|uniref:DUF4136 domain-containing protein n=1 Tax=Olleya sp. R77988 TaxID=3093875 RepID=UPI0037CA528E
MKKIMRLLPIMLVLITLTSCSTVKVAADYDKAVNFDNYKTFAFFKSGIDKAEINDIDKRRILRAIETELTAKGYTKSENPDVLVSIFTKSNQRVDIYNNRWGVGAWGWGRFGWGFNNQPAVSTSTQGVLFVDLIDANKKELVWQGQGTGYLSKNMDKKEARINEFVTKIMEKYPPGMEK